jgi:hypothetical protein
MKKLIIGVLVLVLAAYAVDKFLLKKKHADTDAGSPTLRLDSKNSEAFNNSFEKLLTGYFSLKEAIADYDTTRADKAALELSGYADSLDTKAITGDSTGHIRNTAQSFASGISAAAKGLPAKADLTEKKRSFQLISESLYNLVRTVRYDRQVLYHQHCPMAFNDTEEAWWISNNRKIDNPYMGRKHPKYHAAMTNCGDITDSLDYAKKH